MDELSRFCCQNTQCTDYGKRGAGNLTACMRFGKEKRLRLLYCRTCHARCSERKGTPLFAARLPEATVHSVLEHLAEGCGIRKTSRLVGVSRGTVARAIALRWCYCLVFLRCYIFTPNSQRLMNKPMTRSCICVDFEKQIVLRTRRLIRVRSVRCLRSSCWVWCFPTSWRAGAKCRW
jgi:hypothetical protein